MIGTCLAGRYRLDEELGSGSMGLVYRAHDLVLERDVAVKVVAGGTLGSEGRSRLLREARAAARLNHPNIVSVHDAGEEAGAPYIVMELVLGRNLRELPPRSTAEGLDLMLQVCEGLHHAHGRQIVHRDVKPENILIVEDNGRRTAKLTDFGVARLTCGPGVSIEGAIVGTALYMAPEQAAGETPDGRADLYSVGAVLYEMVAGRPPFVGTDALVIIAEHLYAPVVPPRTHRSDVSPRLEELILKLLAKRREDRPGSARELAESIASLVSSGLAPALEAGDEDAAATVRFLGQLARGRLIGRRPELSNLRELWNGVLRGQGRMALISGEPGVGKTRLAGEALVHAQLSGALVLRGGCYEFEAATPYLPFVEALRAWVGTRDPASLKAMLGSTASELVRLAPEIETKIGPLAVNPPLSSTEERLRLFDNIARFLKARAAERGVLVFLDDLHWADQGTLSLLHYLLRSIGNDRVFLLGAYREAELDRAHPLAAALVEWNREGLMTRIALDRLGREETAGLLATLFGQKSVSPDFVDAMFHETEGNPFFIEEVVKSLIEGGQIYREGGEWQRRDVADLTIPQSVKEAIGRRLNRLTPACLEILHTASAIGKVFSFDVLAAVSAISEDQVLDGLDEASGVQLIRAERDDRFTFTHDKVREVLYSEQNPVRRHRLHLRLGEALEKLHQANLDAHVQDLAHHFIRGGNLARGLEYSKRAAALSERVFAHDAALAYLDEALECAESLNDPKESALVHEEIAVIHRHTGSALLAAGHFEKALALTTDPARRAAIKCGIGDAYAMVGDQRGLVPLEEAIAELDPETQTSEIARATAVMGRIHHYRLEHGRAIEVLERARKLAEPLNDPALTRLVYSYLAGACQHMARYEESAGWARRCIALGKKWNDPGSIAIGHEFLSEILPTMGLWRESLEHSSRNREIAVEIGARDRIAWADFAAQLAGWIGGRLDLALAAGNSCIALADEIGETRLATLARTFRAIVLTERGDDQQALEDIEIATRNALQINQQFLIFQSRCAAGHYHHRRGDWARATDYLAAAARIVESTDNYFGVLRSYAQYAETLLESGRVDEAWGIARIAEARARESGSAYFIATVSVVLALLHEREGSYDKALELFDSAIASFEHHEISLSLGRALERRAALFRQMNRVDPASMDLERARGLFKSTGARRDLERVSALKAH